MSESISTPAAGGLLSLNISAIPPAVGSAQSGNGGLFSGFGAILGQIPNAAQGTGQGANGGVLPLSGAQLPSQTEQALPEQALMRQRMLQVAQLLEQQRTGGLDDLPAELGAELAKALRDYAEQQPLLPVATEQVQVVDEAVEPLPELLTASEGQEVDSVEEVLPVSGDGPEGEVETSTSVIPVVTAPVPELTESPAAEEVGPAVQAEQGGSESSLDEAEQSSNADETVALRPAVQLPEQAAVVAQQALSDRGMSALTGEEVSALASQGRARPNVAATAVAPQEIGQSGVSAPVDSESIATQKAVEPVITGAAVAMADVAEEAVDRPVITARENNRVNGAAEKSSPQLVTAVGPTEEGVEGEGDERSVQQRELAKSETQIRETELLQPRRPQGELQTRSEQLLKTVAEPTIPQKFEAALDFSQELMKKVAAGEKVGDQSNSFLQRLDTAGATSAQSVSNLAQPTTAQKVVTDAQNLMMPQQVKLNTAAWNNALGERAVMLATQNGRVAEIQLDPPELGSLHVRVQVNQDQVSLSFTSPHAHVRDAVEQSLPRLREMFAEQGLALQDSSVSDQSADQQRREQLAEQKGNVGGYSGLPVEDAVAQARAEGRQTLSLVDYYA